jgi:hypothetical protein
MNNQNNDEKLPRVELSSATEPHAVIVTWHGQRHVFHTDKIVDDFEAAMDCVKDTLGQDSYIRGLSIETYLEKNKLIGFDAQGYLTRDKTQWAEK